jgi:hypothetical protein
MDFSSVSRVLESLQRRQPPLEDAVLEQAVALQASITSSSSSSSDTLDLWVTTLDSWMSSNSSSSRWEPLAAGIFLATNLLTAASSTVDESSVYVDGPRVPVLPPTTIMADNYSSSSSSSLILPSMSNNNTPQKTLLCQRLHAACRQHLEHKEPRVRTLVAKAGAAYAPLERTLAKELHQCLVASIHAHLLRGREAWAAVESQEDGATSNTTTTTTNTETGTSTIKTALDDTTGWRALETNWQCLALVICARRQDYFTALFPNKEEDEAMQIWADLQYSSVEHVNRHVRAAGMAALEQCVLAAAEDQHSLLRDPHSQLRQTVVAVLKTGLADNWSQVRMAASVLCRVFLQQVSPLMDHNDDDDVMLAVLLPRMCLNRFYLAQGVKLYSHETWKLVFPDSGVPVVARHLPAMVRYYVQMCDADNHVVREAACQAVAELAVRLGGDRTTNTSSPNDNTTEPMPYRDLLLPHLDVLLQALLMCFHDESWPVRDEACLACAILCKSFPEECRPEFKTLWERWTEQLTDQIWSVRQDAAVALGNALDAYGDSVWTLLTTELIPTILPAARDQPPMSRAQFKAHIQDAEAHTDTQLYSCGSLAPKLSKTTKAGAGRIGCGNCGIDRPKAPWEATDGCIYLLREICLRVDQIPALQNDGDTNILIPLLTELTDVCRLQHFPQAEDLRATLWRQLPVMAQALGKQRFNRRYLDLFLDLLLTHLQARSVSTPLSWHAAAHCADELANFCGRAIFRARLDDFGQKQTFDQAMQQRREEEKMIPDAGLFSPYGPPGLLDGIGGAAAALPAGRFP